MWKFCAIVILLVDATRQTLQNNLGMRIVNTKVEKQTDLTSFIVKETCNITFRNFDEIALTEYVYASNDDVYITFSDGKGHPLTYTKRVVTHNLTLYFVKLPTSLYPWEEGEILINVLQPGKVQPTNKFRDENDDQLFLWRSNFYFYSPYITDVFTTSFVCESACIFPDLPENLPSPSGSYNYKHQFSFRGVPPFATSEICVIFSTERNLLIVRKLRRSVEVLHFEKMLIEDQVEVYNGGPSFRKFNPKENQKHRKYLHTFLPSSADSVSLYDDIGYNFKYKFMSSENYTTILFSLRYPLLGGWKSNYVIRYVVPTYEYVYRNGTKYVLSVRAVDHVFDDALIEEAEVRITLPGGADLEEIFVPDGFTREPDEHTFTNLNYLPRQTVVLRGKRLLEDHISNTDLVYSFETPFLFIPAYLIAFYVFSCLIVVAAYFRSSYTSKK